MHEEPRWGDETAPCIFKNVLNVKEDTKKLFGYNDITLYVFKTKNHVWMLFYNGLICFNYIVFKTKLPLCQLCFHTNHLLKFNDV